MSTVTTVFPRLLPGLRPRLLVLGLLASALAGCITGHEAEDALRHDKARELEEARTLHEIGEISDAEYAARKARIESER